ncbi:serine hydrolase domain-containing protein [Prauserella endophytica]|uniref:Beta-lactamase family protein n=1 Tax=Prauserella endophytica TaxID=1592324 RepID=A0ABY2SA48_9PSEU|nr:serine hydrolase [Prauserella endophytica]PXY29103.1 hypothetical protein BAY59_15855 [Prauserella coralliicola]TKG72790.1 beta-lactamase family protein [Prauserella endophytica]
MTRTTTRWLAGAVSGVPLAGTVPIAPAAAQENEDAGTQAVLDRHQGKAGPGAAVHAGRGAGWWTLAGGSADVGGDRAVTATGPFRAGSQTKTFTLLNHTAGLPDNASGATARPAGTCEPAALVRAAMDDSRVTGGARRDAHDGAFPPEHPDGYGLGKRSQYRSCGVVAWRHDGTSPTGHSSLTMATDDGRFASSMTSSNMNPQAPSSPGVADAALCEGECR